MLHRGDRVQVADQQDQPQRHPVADGSLPSRVVQVLRAVDVEQDGPVGELGSRRSTSPASEQRPPSASAAAARGGTPRPPAAPRRAARRPARPPLAPRRQPLADSRLAGISLAVNRLAGISVARISLAGISLLGISLLGISLACTSLAGTSLAGGGACRGGLGARRASGRYLGRSHQVIPMVVAASRLAITYQGALGCICARGTAGTCGAEATRRQAVARVTRPAAMIKAEGGLGARCDVGTAGRYRAQRCRRRTGRT